MTTYSKKPELLYTSDQRLEIVSPHPQKGHFRNSLKIFHSLLKVHCFEALSLLILQ